MRKLSRLPAVAILSIVAAVAPLALAQNTDSIVAAAKQKTAEKKAKRVITDDDMPRRTAPEQPAVAAVPSATTAAPSGGPVAAGSTAAGAPSEAAAGASASDKSDKVVQLQKKLETATQERSGLVKKLQVLAQKAANTEDENHRRMYLDVIENQQTTLSEYDRLREELERQIAEEQAKKNKQNSQQ